MELALRLGMTLTELRSRMTWDEYLRWAGYKAARQKRALQLRKAKKEEYPW